jgi:predicted aconitase with swiveling domain
MAAVADALWGREVHPATTVIVATSPEVKHAADRMGLTARIEAAGAVVAAGICFYQSYAGELAEANGWRRLLTNSAKRQHHRRLRLPPDPGEPRALRRFRRRRPDRLMATLLRCHKGTGPPVSGIALVAKDNFSARYDLDRKRGVFSRPSHALAGQSYQGRILVLDEAKGGVATAWMLRDMKGHGIVPLALVFNRVNPIIAQGAAFAGVALVDRFDGDVTRLFHTGDRLRIDPAAGEVEILSREPDAG